MSHAYDDREATTETSHPWAGRPDGTLILSRRHVCELLSLDESIDAVEEGFRKQSAAGAIPPGVLSAPASGGAFHVKAAGLQLAHPYFAAKLNGNFYDNSRRYGLPRIQGLIILCSAESGYPLAVMDSTEITEVRTAAATAVAAKHLARQDASVVTVCGCGLQGRVQLRALSRVRGIKKVFAVDLRQQVAEKYADELSASLGVEVTPTQDLHASCRASDVCVTCTPSQRPMVETGDLSPGVFLAAVGADSEEKQELSSALLAQSKLVVDHLQQCAEIGELHHAIAEGLMTCSDVHSDLEAVIAGHRPGRVSDDEVIVFDSTGVAHQDVACASLVFEKAVQQNIGIQLNLLHKRL
ncbi:MAG TPA: ornithine cyclodeaminase family protein [Acidobacteriota bacterium]|nr:ornithine cyclodeaminase family protein [Acidobacteriota bacterium]